MNADASPTPIRWGPLTIPITTAVLIPAALRILLRRPEMPMGVPARYLVGVPLAALGSWMVADAVSRVYLRQQTPLGDKPPEYLVRVGWYRVIRNPMAAGMTVLLVGEALMLCSVPVLTWAAVVFAVSCTAALKVEEPSLLAAFGDEYAGYARRTPRWLPSPTHLRALLSARRAERGNRCTST
ncbi:MAG: isoprenylcysteine carboxylmethyltransferase family protein [Pseudonocardiales bacterium]|nr:isoprenylcysteine carboxylmethyltransferase family protein [Pseudonocardiales bacterium]